MKSLPPVPPLNSREDNQFTNQSPPEQDPHVTGTFEHNRFTQAGLAKLLEIPQSVAGELMLERLAEKLLVKIMKYFGAERAVLIFLHGGVAQLQAEAQINGGKIECALRPEINPEKMLPVTVMEHVTLTHTSLLLPDAVTHRDFSEDAYLRSHHPCSILCVPLGQMTSNVGAIYLEHRQLGRAFSAEHQAMLDLLAPPATNLLENARLYAELKTSDNQLRTIIDTIPTLVWISRADGASEFANQRWMNYLGLSKEHTVVEGWEAAIHPVDAPQFFAQWRHSIDTGVEFEAEARLRRSDGVYRHFLFRAAPLRNQGGVIIKWYGTSTDIEERKRTEQDLWRNQAYMKHAQALSHTGFVRLRLSDGQLSWSEESARIYGYDPEQPATQLAIMQRVHPDDKALLESVFQRAYAGDASFDFEHRLIMPDGSIKYIANMASSVRDECGHEEVIGAVMDITARRQVEINLRLTQAYLAEAQKLTHSGSFNWKVSNQKLIWSDETYRILGIDSATPPTLVQVFKRVHPADLGRVQCALDEAVRSASDFEIEHRVLTNSGAVRHLHAFGRATIDASGQLEFFGAVLDVTQRKLAAATLRASEQLAHTQLEALAAAKEALAHERDPAKMLEQVLRVMIRRLGGEGADVWVIEDRTRRIELLGSSDGKRWRPAGTRPDAPAYAQLNFPTGHPVWTEFFRTGSYCAHSMLTKRQVMVRLLGALDSRLYEWLPLEDEANESIGNVPAAAFPQHRVFGQVGASLSVPMFLSGAVTGCLTIYLRRWREPSNAILNLARALAYHVTLAIQLAQLAEQNRVSAILEERTRLARDIHDTLAQSFTAVIIQLEAASDAASRDMQEYARKHIETATATARGGLEDARRSVQALRHIGLEGNQLAAALQHLLEGMAAGTSLSLNFRVQGAPVVLPWQWEEHLLRISQEAMTNALRHAKASTFTALLVFNESQLLLTLADDGVGFEVAKCGSGFGTIGMKERAIQMGGRLTLQSMPGSGTAIRLQLAIATTS